MLQYNRTVSYSKASRGWFCLLRTLVSRYRVFFSTRKLYEREGSGDCYSLSNLVFLVGIFRNSVTFSEWFFPFLHHCYHRLLAVTLSRQSRIVKSVLFLFSYFFLSAFFLSVQFPLSPPQDRQKREREGDTQTKKRRNGHSAAAAHLILRRQTISFLFFLLPILIPLLLPFPALPILAN